MYKTIEIHQVCVSKGSHKTFYSQDSFSSWVKGLEVIAEQITLSSQEPFCKIKSTAD